VVFIPEIKLYLNVFAIIIDTDGPGTTSNKKVANKKGMKVCMNLYKINIFYFMNYSEKLENNILKIFVSGDLDLENYGNLRDQVSAALQKNMVVALDMCEVSYVDSSGVAALIESKQKAEKAGKEFKIQNPSEAVTSVLNLAKLDTFFVIEN
jgi:anti-sigma B factor antagonist